MMFQPKLETNLLSPALNSSLLKRLQHNCH